MIYPFNMLIFHCHVMLSGWWFGPWMLFFNSVGNVIILTDELIFFRGVGQPPTSYSLLSIKKKTRHLDGFRMIPESTNTRNPGMRKTDDQWGGNHPVVTDDQTIVLTPIVLGIPHVKKAPYPHDSGWRWLKPHSLLPCPMKSYETVNLWLNIAKKTGEHGKTKDPKINHPGCSSFTG